MWYYANALRKADHALTVIDNVDDAVEWLQENGADVDCIILDVLMPPGKSFRGHPDVKEGTNSGYLLAQKLPSIVDNVPVVALTHLLGEDTERLSGLPNVQCVLSKHDCTPKRLVEVLHRIVIK